MTEREAIDLLDNLKGTIDDTQDNDYDSAFNIAIKTLEKQTLEDNALNIDMDNQMHFTDEQIAWIENYIDINAKRQRAEDIDEFLEIVKFHKNEYDGIWWAIRELEELKEKNNM